MGSCGNLWDSNSGSRALVNIFYTELNWKWAFHFTFLSFALLPDAAAMAIPASVCGSGNTCCLFSSYRRTRLCSFQQLSRQKLLGAAPDVCVASLASLCVNWSRTVDWVGNPWLPLRTRGAVRTHKSSANATHRVHVQFQGPAALLGPQLCGLAAFLFPPAKFCSLCPERLGRAEQSALACHSKCGRFTCKGRTPETDWASWLFTQVVWVEKFTAYEWMYHWPFCFILTQCN